MVYVRRSVWANGGDFNDPLLLWYAKGVGELKKRALTDKTSWNFMAAIHGIDTGLWTQYGYMTSSTPLPPKPVQDLYWNQCQHQSWYFLPWHRGYVWSIESLVRDAIVKLGGPADWALPYWNYSDTNQPNARMLPPAFAATTLPDGSANPLYVTQRYGLGTTPIVLPANDVTLGALTVPVYTGTSRINPGFGGLKTGFSHGGGVNGALESKPHNIVHVDVGGQASNGDPGLMSDPDTAGLDPIFWMHHCNIDRLWQVWLTSNPGHVNPTDPAWLNGPLDRKFVVPTSTGEDWFYTPADVLNTQAAPLNYVYQELGGVSNARPVPKAARAALAAAAPETTTTEAAMPAKEPELLGANAAKVAVVGGSARSDVNLDTSLTKSVMNNMAANPTLAAAAEDTAPEGERLYLALEGIKAAKSASVIDVYVNLPEDAKPEDHPALMAGTVALFGVRQASEPDGTHGGAGVTEVLDITRLYAGLNQLGQVEPDKLSVHLVPRGGLSEEAGVTVDQISVYRQEQ